MDSKSYPEEIDLQKYWLVIRRRWPILLGVMAGSIGLAGAASYVKKPTFQAQGKLLFQSSRTTALTGVGEKFGSLESLKREGNPLDTQAVVVQSMPIMQEVIQSLKLKDKTGKPLDPESLKIKVDPIVGTDVLKVTFPSEDPKVAAAVVNELMKAYIANNILTNRAEALAAGNFLGQEIPRAQAELEQAAEDLRVFQSDNRIVSLDKESTAAVTTLSGLNDQINQVRAQLADTQAQQQEIGRQGRLDADRAVEATSLSQLPAVQIALADLQKVQAQLANERARYREGHPNIMALERQEAGLKDLLRQRIAAANGGNGEAPEGDLQMSTLKQKLTTDYVQFQSQRLGLEQRLAELNQLQSTFRGRADRIPTLAKTQDDLERRLAIARKSYENLRTRLEDTKVAENQTVGNARVIQPAVVPTAPQDSGKTLYLGLGAGVGLMLGVAAAFLVDLVDRSLKSVKETQTLFGYTLLGIIPRFKSQEAPPLDLSLSGISSRVVVATAPRSLIHEAYRMLQANLKFTSLDKKICSIVITSSIAGEGKSEVAANLAATLAQSGKKVLLVDTDLRSPSQHHLWGLVNSVGLSNVIVDVSDLPQAIQEINPNLSVISAGVMPPDPLTLLESESMHSLLTRFSQDYDYVLLDSPPLVGMADAAILGKLADGVLLVTRPGVVNTASAKAAKALLERSEANVLGLVANGVNLKQEPDSYFYYSVPTPERNTVTIS
jgi:polysaccharide biosynthesis transport protein